MSPAIGPALLWSVLPTDVHHRLRRCLDKAASESLVRDRGIVFFRADDVGVPGRRFSRLVDLFRGHQVPLTLAVVPAWLTKLRWQRLLELCGRDRDLWSWMQHGWRHLNHEPHGKKLEFGPSRPFSRKRKDLRLGFQRLSTLMGENLLPAFTPPWNRCDHETISALQELGYKALSRSWGAQPPSPAEVPDFPITVDLHTRKEKDAEISWQSLFKELGDSLSRGFCGIMIHHQRMNDEAFDFLDLLLRSLKQCNGTNLVHLGTLLQEGYTMSG